MRILIENGTLVSGTGEPAFRGNVIIEGDRIAAVRAGESAISDKSGFDQIVDATGALVTPGFIDAHSHSDAALLAAPDAFSKRTQGITTE